ncbi:MAG: hypothetical protein R2827_00565 [Bdellovibrionales bacterium]
MKNLNRIIAINFLLAGLILSFQNCASNVPAGSTENLSEGGNPDAGTQQDADNQVDQVILPPTGGNVNPGDDNSPTIDSRLDGFIAKCNSTTGIYEEDGNVRTCTYIYPALKTGDDIARMIWGKYEDSYEPEGRDFSTQVHAEAACKQIMGGNNVFPYGTISLTTVQANSTYKYWDYVDGGWQLVNSSDATNIAYYVISQIHCRFYDQDGAVGSNNITFN